MHALASLSSESVGSYMRFSLPIHEVDSRTLGVTLLETDNLLQCIVRNLDTENEVALRVKALRPGSFELFLELHSFVIPAMLAAQPVLPYLKQTIETMIEFVKLKRALKSGGIKESSRDNDRIIVTGHNNVVINVNPETLNVFNHQPQAHEAVERQFSRLEEDESIESFEILDGKRKSMIEVQRDEFASLSEKGEDTQVSHEDIIEERDTTLVITKPVLEGKQAFWQFIDETGSKASAKMTDEKFIQRVREGETFAMGDRLGVRLRITKSFDENLGIHAIKKREILEVHDHIQKSSQLGIDFGDGSLH